MTKRLNMSRILTAGPIWVLAMVLLSAPSSRAEDPPARHHHMENRFLFVIDTASAMKSRSNGIEQAVAGLLTTGMKGELRKGDTIGLWTYSDLLSTDFPMQVWSEAKEDDIINHVREHLGILVYEKRAHLENAWTAIHQVVTSSERLTIILIYDGAELMKGISLDKDINPQLKKFAREFRAAHQPFVLVLAAHDGAITDFTINYPDSVVVPHTADPLPPPEAEEPSVVATPPPPIITNPPPPKVVINLTGADFPHHTYSTPPAANNSVAEATPAPGPAPAIVTNAPPPAQPAPVAAQTAQTTPAVNTNVPPPEPALAPPPAASSPPPAPIVAAPAKPVPAAPTSPPTVGPATVPPAAIAPVPVAPAVVVAPAFQQVAMLVIAFSLLTIAVALVMLVVWRWRSRSQPSLISQSIDRPR